MEVILKSHDRSKFKTCSIKRLPAQLASIFENKIFEICREENFLSSYSQISSYSYMWYQEALIILSCPELSLIMCT